MAKFNIEFKSTSTDDNGSETRHIKKVVDQAELATFITTIATQSGIEFFTLRRVPEAKSKVTPQKVLLKEVK